MVHIWALKVMLLPLVIWFVFFALVGLRLFLEVHLLGLTIQALAFAAIFLLGYTWAYLYWRFYRWRLGEDEVRIWKGIVFRKRMTIPYMRVQNVNVVRGPFLLLFGLSGVEVETAGQKGSYYSLQGAEGYLPGLIEGEATADGIIDGVKSAKEREGL